MAAVLGEEEEEEEGALIRGTRAPENCRWAKLLAVTLETKTIRCGPGADVSCLPMSMERGRLRSPHDPDSRQG